jgi:hypothetical protein
MEVRAREEHSIVLMVPYYDVARVKKEESDDEETVVVAKVRVSFSPSRTGQRVLFSKNFSVSFEECISNRGSKKVFPFFVDQRGSI